MKLIHRLNQTGYNPLNSRHDAGFRRNTGTWIAILITMTLMINGCHFFVKKEAPDLRTKTAALDVPVPIDTATPEPTPTPTFKLSSRPVVKESPTPTYTPEPTPTFAPEDLEMVQMNFEDASLREILIYLAELAGWDYLISPEVGSGSVTLRTTKPFRKVDVEKVLYTILDMNNLAVIEGPMTSEGRPAFKKIIPKPDAKHSPILTRFGNDLSMIPQEDILVTQIITTEFVAPDEILNTIRPLISPDATIITHPGANMMIITEISSNIRRLLDIIGLLDQDTALMELEIFQVKFADVQDIVSVIDRVLSSRVSIGGSTTSGGTNPRTRRAPKTKATTSSGSSMNAIMIPDARSNSLIVFALRKDLEFIREIIAILDVDIYVTKKAYIYYVENAIASDMASLLEAVFTGKDSGTQTQRRPTSRTSSKPTGSSAANVLGSADVQGEVSIVADDRTNSLIIVTAPVNYPYIVDIIKKLDIMPKQVLIEVLIADVTLDESSELGVSWELRGQGSVDVGGDTYNFDSTMEQTVGGPPSGFLFNLFEASRFEALISAKANENKLEVLSSPHIMVANNMEATIDVGSDVPVVTRESDNINSDSNVTRTIEYRNTGILLTVTPHINSANFVNLEISQEVSNISETAIEGISSPVIEKRKATTTVMVANNQTLVIGGMIARSKNPAREGVPWLYRVPLLKYLFGKHKYTERASELLIFITPHVVNSPEEAFDISERMKQKIDIDSSFYQDFIGM